MRANWQRRKRRRSGVAIIGTPILRPSDLRSEIAHSQLRHDFCAAQKSLARGAELRECGLELRQQR